MIQKFIITIVFAIFVSSTSCITTISADEHALDNKEIVNEWYEQLPENNEVEIISQAKYMTRKIQYIM